MSRHLFSVVTTLAALALLLPEQGQAQIRASERQTLSQTVDGTVVTVDYARPRARGRAPIFGNVVHWGEVWTPGANAATTLEVSKDITIDGHDVPAGKYSMWMVPGEEGWELWLDPEWDLFHTERPEKNDEQIRFPIWARRGFHTEVLTFSVPAYDSDGLTLKLAWGQMHVPMQIGVEPSMRRVVTEEEAAPYVGDFNMEWTWAPPGAEGPPPDSPFEIEHTDEGMLMATTTFHAPGWPDPLYLVLQPMAEGVFMPATWVDGDIWNSLAETYIEFEFEGEKATGFKFRGEDDDVFAEGERK